MARLGVLSLWSVIVLFTLAARTQRVRTVKIDCHPIAGATREKCQALGCIWAPVEATGGRDVAGNGDGGQPAGLKLPQELNQLVEGAGGREKGRVGEPWCYYPDEYIGYEGTASITPQVKLQRVRPSVMGKTADVERVLVKLEAFNEGGLLRIRFIDESRNRFEPALPELSMRPMGRGAGDTLEKSGFKVELGNGAGKSNETDNSSPFILTIRRGGSGDVVFSSDLSKLIFTDKFIQLNTALSSPYLYGLGEHYGNFLKFADNKHYQTFSLYNTDRLAMPGGTRSYGGFPFFINLDSANQSAAHGVYLRNSNAMDIVLQNDLSLTFRPIGGILDFFLFIGPTPLDVTRQFQELVGLPDLPPRWSLGFHLCRYNYGSLEKTERVWARTRAAGIPFDVQWNDIDYMERGNDFTLDPSTYKGLPEFVDRLHASNMHYMLIFDPGLSQEEHYYPYELGEQMQIWIQNATGRPLVGKVWNQSGRTVFPDFSHSRAHEFWGELFERFRRTGPAFDGAWIDMNDISNFVDGSLDGCPLDDESVERPPYLPGGYSLQTHSLCLSAKHQAGIEYDVHNLYAFYETIATRKALDRVRPGRRSPIISRSTHPGQGRYGGHWSGDVLSTWDYLRWSIPSLLEHSMYGFSLVGTDICGFAGDAQPEMCARWSTLGAFYTFARNHNDDKSIDQDPVAMGPLVVEANKQALSKRYSLLPYLYTLINRAHLFGEPVARSMLFEFFDQADRTEMSLAEDQFMWGSALLVAPIVAPNTTSKSTYLPAGRWFELDVSPEYLSFEEEHVKVPKLVEMPASSTKGGRWHETTNVAPSNLVLFYRAGQVIPVYAQVRQTIPDIVRQPIGLEVALCPRGRARGQLILDDGESTELRQNHAEFAVKESGELSVALEHDDYSSAIELGQVKVYGVLIRVASVKLRLGAESKDLAFSQKGHMLMFDLAGARATKSQPLVVQWAPASGNYK